MGFGRNLSKIVKNRTAQKSLFLYKKKSELPLLGLSPKKLESEEKKMV